MPSRDRKEEDAIDAKSSPLRHWNFSPTMAAGSEVRFLQGPCSQVSAPPVPLGNLQPHRQAAGHFNRTSHGPQSPLKKPEHSTQRSRPYCIAVCPKRGCLGRKNTQEVGFGFDKLVLDRANNNGKRHSPVHDPKCDCTTPRWDSQWTL